MLNLKCLLFKTHCFHITVAQLGWSMKGRLSPRYDAHRRDCLRGIMYIVEIVSAVGCTPWRLSPRSDVYRKDLKKLCVLDSGEIWNN